MVRYEKPVPEKIVASRRFPSEVGWLRDLYRYRDADPAKEQWLERQVFQRIDSMAAPVLGKMLEPNPQELSPDELSGWALLIRSLMHRTPENLRSTMAASARIENHLSAEIRANYDDLRGAGDPQTYEQYLASIHPYEGERAALRVLPNVIMNERIGNFLVNMKWRVFEATAGCPSLLISDDSVARTDGISNPGGHLAMPLSPSRLLVLAESDDAMRTVSAMSPREMIRNMNKWTVESARRFVVAADRGQDRFVYNRFGSDPKESLTTNISLIDKMAQEGSWMREARQRRASSRRGGPAAP